MGHIIHMYTVTCNNTNQVYNHTQLSSQSVPGRTWGLPVYTRYLDFDVTVFSHVMHVDRHWFNGARGRTRGLPRPVYLDRAVIYGLRKYRDPLTPSDLQAQAATQQSGYGGSTRRCRGGTVGRAGGGRVGGRAATGANEGVRRLGPLLSGHGW